MSKFFSTSEFIQISVGCLFRKTISELAEKNTQQNIQNIGKQLSKIIWKQFRVYSQFDSLNFYDDIINDIECEIQSSLTDYFEGEDSYYLKAVAKLTQLKYQVEINSEFTNQQLIQNLTQVLGKLLGNSELLKNLFVGFLENASNARFMIYLEDLIKFSIKDSRDFFFLINMACKKKYVLQNKSSKFQSPTPSVLSDRMSSYHKSSVQGSSQHLVHNLFKSPIDQSKFSQDYFKKPQPFYRRTIKFGVSQNIKFKTTEQKFMTKFEQKLEQIKEKIECDGQSKSMNTFEGTQKTLQNQKIKQEEVFYKLVSQNILAFNSSESSRSILC